MQERPAPFYTILLLGASLLGLGGLLALWNIAAAPPSTDILVSQKIIGPDGHLVFNGTFIVTAGNGTVLGALLRSAELGAFDVNVTYAYYGKAFVESIAGYDNTGLCGWIYERNGIRGSRSVDEEVLAGGDALRWGWDCEG